MYYILITQFPLLLPYSPHLPPTQLHDVFFSLSLENKETHKQNIKHTHSIKMITSEVIIYNQNQNMDKTKYAQTKQYDPKSL